jgi:methylase of polypeptide subunit release factors
MPGTEPLWKIWKYKGIGVNYRNDLDGTGRSFVRPYVNFLRSNVFGQRRFEKAFEWCSGAGFIGFSLLAEGICKKLCVADINPDAVEALRKTVHDNGLDDVVTVHHSDNFQSIPAQESFDLVVGNPPWYYHDNPSHRVFGSNVLARALHLGRLRAIDDGWKIHEGFYEGVSDHLNPGAVVCPYVQAPFDSELWFSPRWCRGTFLEPVPYNVRPRPPFEAFKEMIDKSGLAYMATVSDAAYQRRTSAMRAFPQMWFMVSRKLA